MITLEQVENEISEVLARGNNRDDIAYLANLFICKEAMRGENLIATKNTSEFARCVNGKCFTEVLPVLEELLDAVAATNPRLYQSFISMF